jgi:hypothetical protein
MKTMIRSVPEVSGAEYQLWAELSPVQGPGGLHRLHFTTVWTGAKQPEAPHNKADFFLERQDLHRLHDMIKEALA